MAAVTTRAGLRQQRMRRRLAEAATPRQRADAAYDWLRSSAEHLGKRGTRGEGLAGVCRGASDRIFEDTARYLAGIAAGIDAGHYDHVRGDGL